MGAEKMIHQLFSLLSFLFSEIHHVALWVRMQQSRGAHDQAVATKAGQEQLSREDWQLTAQGMKGDRIVIYDCQSEMDLPQGQM